MIRINSKLQDTGITIFTKMSKMAQEHGAINLGQGFPDFDCSDKLKDLCAKYMALGKNQYAAMPGVIELRDVIARKCEQSYRRKINAEQDITITAGATQAIFNIISAFIHSGDEVILFDPAYDSCKPSIELQGGQAVIYELKAPEFNVDWKKFKGLLTERTKMVIINNPHNPLGTVYTKDDMLELQSALAGTNIIVLSDEVYEHIVFDGHQHQSVMLFDDLYQRSISVFSFGKTFHMTGWKIGYCVAPDHLMKEVRKVHQWNVFSVNSFVQYALAEYMQDESSYSGLSEFYQNKRDVFTQQLRASRFKPLPSKGSYFQLVDYSEISDSNDIEFAEWLTQEKGIAAIPISVFYKSKLSNSLIRFCFAKTNEVLEKAGCILKEI